MLTFLEMDVDIVEEIVKGLLAGKEVVYGKHAGDSIKLCPKLQSLLPQELSVRKLSLQGNVCKAKSPPIRIIAVRNHEYNEWAKE